MTNDETTITMEGIICSNVHFAAAVMHGLTISGSAAELRAVADAMARAVDAIEGAE